MKPTSSMCASSSTRTSERPLRMPITSPSRSVRTSSTRSVSASRTMARTCSSRPGTPGALARRCSNGRVRVVNRGARPTGPQPGKQKAPGHGAPASVQASRQVLLPQYYFEQVLVEPRVVHREEAHLPHVGADGVLHTPAARLTFHHIDAGEQHGVRHARVEVLQPLRFVESEGHSVDG